MNNYYYSDNDKKNKIIILAAVSFFVVIMIFGAVHASKDGVWEIRKAESIANYFTPTQEKIKVDYDDSEIIRTEGNKYCVRLSASIQNQFGVYLKRHILVAFEKRKDGFYYDQKTAAMAFEHRPDYNDLNMFMTINGL